MYHSKLAALALAVLVIAGLACSAAAPTPAPTSAPTTAPTATLEPATSTPTPKPTATTAPKPTATNTRVPTVSATATSATPGVLFNDDFSSQSASEAKGWVFDQGDNVDYTWSSGKLTISVKKPQWIGLDWPDGEYTNFGAEIEGQALGDAYTEYGLIFRVSGDQATRSYYIYSISTDGKYYVQKKVGGEWADVDPVPSAASTYIKPKAKNTLGVLAEGSKFSLYINGFLVKSFTDADISDGQIGVFAGTAKNDSAQAAISRVTVITVDKAKKEWGSTPASSGPQPTATKVTGGVGTGNGTVAVVNRFPGACQANLWGQKEAVIRAEGNSTKSLSLPPGKYGVHLAADVGEVDLQEFTLPPGGYCQLTCDAASKSVYNSCR